MTKLTDAQRQADMITIGGILNDMLYTVNTPTDTEMAEKFILSNYGPKSLQDAALLHELMKVLSMGYFPLKYDAGLIFRLAKNLSDLVYTKPIRIQNNQSAFCDFRLYDPIGKNLIMRRHGAWIADTFDICPTRFAVLTRLESRTRRSGKTLLPDALIYVNKIPVFLQAGYLYKGEAQMNLRQRIDNLVKYYESLGFININHLYEYDQSVIMYHPNNSGFKI